MIELEIITEDNFEECIGLKVLDSQIGYLASNAYSLSETYALTNHPLNIPMPFAIYNKETMVGFALVVYQPRDINDPDDDEDIYYLSRIMIDNKYQGFGYGKQALYQIIELVNSRPHGPATTLILSSSPENNPAYSLYLSAGFRKMGIKDVDEDEIIKLKLR
ncbi:GNAT family N-acetyltransferase [Marinilactibacillus sp. XAAS-LB27]|uniref:GNAT family N-acetyltransferase n=1 Tax=Marinilactibacillus sp. XAAS-LB27 TaxID=3114538 RepID=UPI002E17DA95|nr:GNAT family N-acetyltransferase [Marinilactibacillus sp. XAAS-LB27]